MTHRPTIYLKSCFYAFCYFILYLVCRTLFRLRIRGRQIANLQSGCIVVARHRSYWDIPLLVAGLGWRNRIHFVARKGLLRNVILAPFVRSFATVISREKFSRRDLRVVLKAIECERIVGIFPEGTTDKRAEVKAGVIHFAKRTGKPFLPINIVTDGPYPPRYPFGFPKVTISVGAVRSVSDLDDGNIASNGSKADRYVALGEQLMKQVDAA